MSKNNKTALNISEINNENTNPMIPNNWPKVSIPTINTIIDVTLVKTRYPLFSFPKNCEMYNVLIVVGIIQREIIGISVYSGKNIGTIIGRTKNPINAKTTENSTVKSLIFLVFVPLASSGNVYFVTIDGKTANILRSCMAR